MDQPPQRQMYKLAGSGFILNGKGQLLVLKRHENDELLPGFWQVPGGAVEMAETVEAAVAREVKGQAGVDAACDRLFGYFVYPDAKHQMSLNLNFICTMRDPADPIAMGGGMVEQAWTDLLGLTNYKMTPEMYEACRWALGSVSKK